jgi:signal transduction histidine kinase
MKDGPDRGTFGRAGLFRKYVVYFVGLVVLVLAINGGLEMWLTYRDTTTALSRAQSEKAEAAARRIDESLSEIERQISWTTRASAATVDQHRADYALLLGQVPAIDELIKLDGAGREQLRVARAGTTVGRNTDYSHDPVFTAAIARGVWYGPVTFDRGEPSMPIAMAHSLREAGVTVARVNLHFLGDLVAALQLGRGVYAYAVGHEGRLLAGAGMGRIAPGADLSELPQVKAALDRQAVPVTFGHDLAGGAVFSAVARTGRMDWHVFVEQPLSQALEPVYNVLARIASLLGAALVIAVLASILLARQMTVPIRALAAGARRLGAGEFDHRIAVRTGDELEALADQFNRMAGQIEESYARLEQKVRERTRDLEEKTQELAIASEHKSQFFANMSHELRTPLNAVLGYSELLVDGLYGQMPAKALEVLERIQSNGRHLLGLINDVLDISKIEAGQLRLSLADYAMKTLVQSAVAATGSLAQNKGLAVNVTIPDGLPTAYGDERRLTQVLLNIVGNAIKFTDKGEIDVAVALADDRFHITVRDTGPGIAPEHQARIFEEFQQVDSSSTREKGGTGLGLAIAKRIVVLHGGDISVESVVGAGSTFHIVLPVRAGEERPAS